MRYFLTDRCEGRVRTAPPRRRPAVPEAGTTIRERGSGRTHHPIDGGGRLERCGSGGGWGTYPSRHRWSWRAATVPTPAHASRRRPSTAIWEGLWAVIPKTPWTRRAAYVAGRNRAAAWMTGGR